VGVECWEAAVAVVEACLLQRILARLTAAELVAELKTLQGSTESTEPQPASSAAAKDARQTAHSGIAAAPTHIAHPRSVPFVVPAGGHPAAANPARWRAAQHQQGLERSWVTRVTSVPAVGDLATIWLKCTKSQLRSTCGSTPETRTPTAFSDLSVAILRANRRRVVDAVQAADSFQDGACTSTR
jgi:hypothetical protein